MVILNSVDRGQDLSFKSKFRVMIQSDGMVAWVPGLKWQTSCSIQLTYFPFDQQQCNVSLVSWIYSLDRLDFETIANETETTQSAAPNILLRYERNAEWHLDSVSISKEYTSRPDASQYVNIHMTVVLSRYSRYFVLNLVVPSVILTLLSVIAYWLPCESGEKISLAVTVLLSYTVLLLIVSDVSPRNGDSIPLLTVYLLSGMILSVLSLMGAITVLNIHHEPPQQAVRESPRWFFLRHIPSCLGSRPLVGTSIAPAETPQIVSNESSSQHAKTATTCEMTLYYRSRARKMEDDAAKEKLRDEWQLYARLIDRCHIVFFAILVSLFTVALMITLHNGPKKEVE